MRSVVLAVVLLSACTVPLDEFCEALMTTSCLRQKACGFAARDVSCDVIMSTTRYLVPPCSQALRTAVDEGRVVYDAAEARHCLDVLASECGTNETCRGAFKGTLPRGEACHTSQECEGDSWCNRTATCPGVCAARQGDGAVVRTFEACNTDRAQFFDDGSVRCVLGRPEGSACTAPVECRWGWSCVDGRCSTAQPTNAPCNRAEECALGHMCMNHVCTRAAPRGAPCGDQLRAGDECQLGLACREEVCGAALSEDEPCGTNPLRCGAGLRCTFESQRKTCVKRSVAGGPCAQLLDCAEGLTCVNAKCEPLHAEGERCAWVGDCQLGLSCLNDRCTQTTCAP